ncbi:MAG: hypothetical protein ACOVQA_11920, partial [Thermoflexibacteraceae bacterium]
NSLLIRLYGAKKFFINSNTNFGSYIIGLYYESSPIVLEVIANNQSFATESYQLLKDIEPYIVDLTTNSGGQLEISSSFVVKIENYFKKLDSLLPNNHPSKIKISQLLDRIKIQETVGLNSKQAWSRLVQNYDAQ